jgi:HEAT repeat protein
LAEIALHDPDPRQRSDAMFWLAQEYPDRAEPMLLEVIDTGLEGNALEQAMFAISELPEDRSAELLLKIAQDPARPHSVRKQAFFWLAQSDDEETLAALTELLTR